MSRGTGNGGEGALVERELAGEIANAIMVGEYPLGSWLRQETLATRFGTSRQPIREALRRLEVIGMVELFPHRGARVIGPDPSSIRDAYLIRAQLESLAARLAATAISEEQLDELTEVFETFRTEIVRDFEAEGAQPAFRDAWVAAHNRFHELILDAASNDRLSHMVRTLNVTLPRNVTTEVIEGRAALEDNIRQHDLVLQTLRLRAEQLAAQAMEEHIRSSGTVIADWFARRRDDPPA
ncbi:GntR family transcriptional regulator [Conexibacter woesei]|uniref:Transcriptional regulator, GntR family n=1 Tax=Conexibacter woesei (strain DSM 14684 / CCUG 47730 / CIP 108061 / JCM 11494 / NBRC 100937 / ID131577) TaxID=469383 RepID=D3FAM1_CONWI|nr:GntR family transcriptional regulator [Conexibacter woesei]ADB51184.1 transcriptional regulator, GntR family [Conexibacter woesei DSM 14684]